MNKNISTIIKIKKISLSWFSTGTEEMKLFQILRRTITIYKINAIFWKIDGKTVKDSRFEAQTCWDTHSWCLELKEGIFSWLAGLSLSPPTLSCLWSLGSKSFLLSLFVLLLLPALYPMKAQLSYLRQRQAWAKTPRDDNNSQVANNSGRVARRRGLETPANGDAKHGPLLLWPNNGKVRTWRPYFPFYYR